MPSAETSNPAVTGNGGDTVLNSISVNDVKKVAILGSAGCGKSSLIHRAITNSFLDEYYQSFSADMYAKQVTGATLNKKRTLHIWCCAGHERYRPLMEQFYEDADAIIIVFDMLNIQSFKEINYWFNESKRLAPTAKVFLVGTKSDDADNLLIKIPDGVAQAKEWNVPFKAISAKTGLNVNELFADIVDAFP